MEQFKCRASASGKLATNPKSKTDLLSQTTKTFIKEWAIERIYGYRKQISSKYLSKGIEMEDEAIDKAIQWLDLGFQVKNEEFFENDYFCGTPDLIIDGVVYDIKCSWSWETFPLLEENIPTDGYETQLQVYMDLLGLKKSKLVYVLLNTPSDFYNQEITYDHLDIRYRIKTYDIEYDELLIEKLKQRVIDSRIYLKNTLEKFDINV
jgi:hypothetical protein